ncbi:hypothetical protein, unlikely [Trypanosoma brucei gambiense DAL972]|uniref:T. brucei spp.-specific protein n=1 Tax=Trypanosoma brucei gambiense (strain MHOM/CI/86/DAL972) TaxID=679716 RepID=C9ZSX9_TRYB9|nr:hypothetical protein, unlikely [Trypanosoma brucei gambiense DAL972]CBH12514.1 hypothetical protein, unlikely [Trypanosoma brucei gambiense DAL972]|eukprot:XP_011774794.1 hypothetical protein, unlikely [Trypanosoma brucei gambiense DAL972]
MVFRLFFVYVLLRLAACTCRSPRGLSLNSPFFFRCVCLRVELLNCHPIHSFIKHMCLNTYACVLEESGFSTLLSPERAPIFASSSLFWVELPHPLDARSSVRFHYFFSPHVCATEGRRGKIGKSTC